MTRIFGVQMQKGDAPDADTLFKARPAVILLIQNAVNAGVCDRIRQVTPDTDIILRYVGTENIFNDTSRTPEQHATDWTTEAIKLFKPCQLYTKLVTTINEPATTGVQGLNARQSAERLNTFLKTQTQMYHDAGFEVIGGNWSVGNPPLVKYDGYGILDLLVESHAQFDYFGYHAYDFPRLGTDVARSFRYRDIYDELPASCRKPIMLTEFGIDGTSAGKGGYKDYTNIADYISQIRGYLATLSKGTHFADAMVKRIALFLYGRERDRWLSFDVADERDTFVPFVATQPEVNVVSTDGLCPFATFRPVTNFGFPTGAHGRNGHPVKAVVLHIAAGNFDAIYPTFANGGASSHFAIAKDGRLEQYVNINDAAYGNGLSYAGGIWYNPYGHIVQPTWPLLEAGVNPNLVTVSVEHDGQTGEPLTEPMNVTRTRLLVWLAQQYGWKEYVPRINLIRHSQLDNVDRASCPGGAFNFDLIAQWANEVISPPTPDGDTMPTPEERKKHAWEDGLNIAYHPDYTFPQVAEKLKLGYPLPGRGEYRYVDAKGATIAAQAFAGAILEAPEGDFANTQAYDWNTGELYNPTPTPTPTTPRLTVLPAAALEWKLKMDVYTPQAGQDFYGLVAVSRPQVDNAPRFAFQVSDASGAQMPNAPCFHVFPDGNYECFSTSGSGYVEFLLGAGSKYEWTLGQSPKDKFYIGTEFRDRNKGEPFAPPKGDTYYFGLPDQRHLDATYSVRLMKG